MRRKRVREPFHFYVFFVCVTSKKNYIYQLDVQNLDKEFTEGN